MTCLLTFLTVVVVQKDRYSSLRKSVLFIVENRLHFYFKNRWFSCTVSRGTFDPVALTIHVCLVHIYLWLSSPVFHFYSDESLRNPQFTNTGIIEPCHRKCVPAQNITGLDPTLQ